MGPIVQNIAMLCLMVLMFFNGEVNGYKGNISAIWLYSFGYGLLLVGYGLGYYRGQL